MVNITGRRAVLSDFLGTTVVSKNHVNLAQEKVKSGKIQGEFGAKKFIKP
jgi:hypothetical protein